MGETQLRLYNTMTRSLEPFETIDPGHARIYTCGPTVYNFSHIGNLRTFLFEDVLRRTLELFGWRVTQVMNLTDVDDKTIRGADAEGISLRNFTDRFIETFFEDLETLRVERAEHYPRATDYISQMAKLVQRLTDKGHTYRSGDSIYFRISTFPGYGKLSGVRLEHNLAGARVDSDEYEKEDARDFVLWKETSPGEPCWQTDLGEGRPGWHLECSAMAMALLGETFDLHSGGVDNIFPHHENEIAQSEGASGHTFARFWLHAEHLVVEGQKMAKSKGNFFTLRDLLDRGYDAAAIRYLLISVPYRQKLNFTFDGLHAARQAIDRLCNTLRRLDTTPACGGDGGLPPAEIDRFRVEFRDGLADDLNTAKALATFHTLLRTINSAIDGDGINEAGRAALRSTLAEFDSVLAIMPESRPCAESEGDAEIDALIEERKAARKNRDFARADQIRDTLTECGVVLEDTPHGTVWHRSEDG